MLVEKELQETSERVGEKTLNTKLKQQMSYVIHNHQIGRDEKTHSAQYWESGGKMGSFI